MAPWLLIMTLLVGCSAFFSASEAALFSLSSADRRLLQNGNASQLRAASLLDQPERLLSAVLFWNLVINLTYFAISSMVTLRLGEHESFSQSTSAGFAVASLLVLIFFSEMLPKSFAVMRNRWLAGMVSFPLSISVRFVDPVIPVLRLVMLFSQRLIWPGLKSESHIEPDDLHRAIEVSTNDEQLIEHEQAVLSNIVELSSIRVDEWMLPRSQFIAIKPPVSLKDLRGLSIRDGYLLISEVESDEVSSSLHLNNLFDLPEDHLEYLATPVSYVPWCATLAQTLEKMQGKNREVAAIVNEYGETIGILTLQDMIDTLFSFAPSRSKRILKQNPVHRISRDTWLVSGMTSLKRLSSDLNTEIPDTHLVTVCGVIQETLHRVAQVGDECDWGPFHFRVLEMPHRGHLLVQVTTQSNELPARSKDRH